MGNERQQKKWENFKSHRKKIILGVLCVLLQRLSILEQIGIFDELDFYDSVGREKKMRKDFYWIFMGGNRLGRKGLLKELG